MAFKVGDKVWSKYHGDGVVEKIYGEGKDPLFCSFEGGKFSYSMDGRYFTEGNFCDKEPVLMAVEDAKE